MPHFRINVSEKIRNINDKIIHLVKDLWMAVLNEGRDVVILTE